MKKKQLLKNRITPVRMEIFIQDHPLSTIDHFRVYYSGKKDSSGEPAVTIYKPKDISKIKLNQSCKITAVFKQGKRPPEKKKREDEYGRIARWPVHELRIRP